MDHHRELAAVKPPENNPAREDPPASTRVTNKGNQTAGICSNCGRCLLIQQHVCLVTTNLFCVAADFYSRFLAYSGSFSQCWLPKPQGGRKMKPSLPSLVQHRSSYHNMRAELTAANPAHLGTCSLISTKRLSKPQDHSQAQIALSTCKVCEFLLQHTLLNQHHKQVLGGATPTQKHQITPAAAINKVIYYVCSIITSRS